MSRSQMRILISIADADDIYVINSCLIQMLGTVQIVCCNCHLADIGALAMPFGLQSHNRYVYLMLKLVANIASAM